MGGGAAERGRGLRVGARVDGAHRRRARPVRGAAAATPARRWWEPARKLAVAARAAARVRFALQILPGRIEFSYPGGAQALLILPTAAGAGGGAVIVGADRQRAFGEDAVRRCAAIATEIVGVALTLKMQLSVYSRVHQRFRRGTKLYRM